MAQSGRALVLPEQKQEPGNGCCAGGKTKVTATTLSSSLRSGSSEMGNRLFKVIYIVSKESGICSLIF